MIKLIIGFVLGFIVATVGVGGITKMADNGVQSAKATLQQQSAEANAAVKSVAPKQ